LRFSSTGKQPAGPSSVGVAYLRFQQQRLDQKRSFRYDLVPDGEPGLDLSPTRRRCADFDELWAKLTGIELEHDRGAVHEHDRVVRYRNAGNRRRRLELHVHVVAGIKRLGAVLNLDPNTARAGSLVETVLKLHDRAVEPARAVAAHPGCRAGHDARCVHRAQLRLDPEYRLVADLEQGTARLDDLAYDEVVLDHGAGLRTQQLELAHRAGRIAALEQALDLGLSHAVRGRGRIRSLACHLSRYVSSLRDCLGAQLLNAPPLAIRLYEGALGIGHQNARQRDEWCADAHRVAEVRMPRDDLSTDARRDERGAIGVRANFTRCSDRHCKGTALDRPRHDPLSFALGRRQRDRALLRSFPFVELRRFFLGLHASEQGSSDEHEREATLKHLLHDHDGSTMVAL